MIVFHWSFPLTIFLIIPVIRLLSLTVNNALLLNPIIRFLLCWVINHRLVRPVLWFFVIWIGNFLGFEDLPVVFDGSFVYFFLINFHQDGVIRLQDHGVQVRSTLALLLVCKVIFFQHVLAFVGEDEMRPFGIPTLVRPKHDVVHRGIAKSFRVAHLWSNFEVATTTFNIFLVFCLVLDDEILVCVAEGIKTCRDAEELGVLCGLDPSILFLIDEPLTRCRFPLAISAFAFFPLTHSPPILPAIAKGFRKIYFAGNEAHV